MGEAFSHHLHLAPKFSPPGGNTRGPGCLPIPCPEGLASSLPARSHQLSYYLSRHKPNYRPCPKGAVGFMGRVRRQRQAGVKPCPPDTHTSLPLSLKLLTFHPDQPLSPLPCHYHGFRIFSLFLKRCLLGPSHSCSSQHSSLLPMRTSFSKSIRLSGSKRSQITGFGLPRK